VKEEDAGSGNSNTDSVNSESGPYYQNYIPFDKMKKSLALSKSTDVPNDKEANNSNMPNQYARVKT
jgi:hypothetical protein